MGSYARDVESLTGLKEHYNAQEEKIKEVMGLFQSFHKKFMDEYR